MATPLEQALQQVGNQIVKQMRANLQRNNNDNTGRLSNSIEATVKDNKLVITMLNYGKWVNYGHERSAGKKPPISAIQFWIKKNAISPKQGITAKQLAYAIQASIGKRGQTQRKAYPFIAPAVETVLKQDLGGIFGKAIQKEVELLFKIK
jgi:hypothetical protein